MKKVLFLNTWTVFLLEYIFLIRILLFIFQKLLDLIEDLKKKLIDERKEKLTLEFKIREEVTQEFTQYLAQREADFK